MTTLTADPQADKRGTANGCRDRLLPSPDFVVERLSGDKFIVGPCHGRAADWLRASMSASTAWVGEGLGIEGRDLQDIVTRATAVGFAVALEFQRRARVIGSGLAVAVH